MFKCLECGGAMIRSGCYDPDGVIPLIGQKEEWVCINLGCKEGKENVKEVS